MSESPLRARSFAKTARNVTNIRHFSSLFAKNGLLAALKVTVLRACLRGNSQLPLLSTLILAGPAQNPRIKLTKSCRSRPVRDPHSEQGLLGVLLKKSLNYVFSRVFSSFCKSCSRCGKFRYCSGQNGNYQKVAELSMNYFCTFGIVAKRVYK